VIRFLLGFVSGLAAAWAALAIWQRVPEFGPVDAIDERAIVPTSELVSSDPPDRPLSYEEAIAMRGRGAWPPPPVTDPAVHSHDAYCRYPARPCVCTVMHPVTGGIGAP